MRADSQGAPAVVAPRRYLPALDGVRALAVLAVIASHIGFGRLTGGWIGVGVFFVLSGYLITSILLAEWDQARRISWRRFYARRMLRLYPALLLMLVLGAFFAPILGNGGTAGGYLVTAASAGLYIQDFVAGLTSSPRGGFEHTWSLAVEEQFYLVWPPILVLLLRHRKRVAAWALAGTALSWICLALTTHTNGSQTAATYLLPHTRGGELLLGCALAAWLHGNPVALRIGWVRRWLPPVALAGLAAVVLVAGPAGRSPLLPLQIPVVALLSAALVLGLVASATAQAASAARAASTAQSSRAAARSIPGLAPGLLERVLGSGPLAGLGRISYGLYLFHFPVIILVAELIPVSWAAGVILSLVITLVVAVLSYRWVEAPMLRLKDRIPAAHPATVA